MFFLFQALPSDNKPSPEHLYNQADSIAFSLWGMDIAWYGIFMFIAFMTAIIFIVIKIWKVYKIPIDPFYWYIFMAIPAAILGARTWSCVIGDAQWEHFFNFNQGGLAIEGGVMLPALLALWWFPFILKKPKYQIRALGQENPEIKQVSTWLFADAILPAILIGQVIGRWGNYFNQEIYGVPITDENMQIFLKNVFPWMYVTSPQDGLDAGWRQPLFLYEMLINLFGFILIFFALEFVNFKKAGDLGIAYFLWYGIVRLCMEPMRAGSYTFATTYWTSAIWVTIGLLLLILNHTAFQNMRQFKIKKIIFTYIPCQIRILFYQTAIILNIKRKYNDVVKKEKINYKNKIKNLSKNQKNELFERYMTNVSKAKSQSKEYKKIFTESEKNISAKKIILNEKIKIISVEMKKNIKDEIVFYKLAIANAKKQFKIEQQILRQNKRTEILKIKDESKSSWNFKNNLCKNVKIIYSKTKKNNHKNYKIIIANIRNDHLVKTSNITVIFENDKNNLIKDYTEFKNKEKLATILTISGFQGIYKDLNKGLGDHSRVLYNNYEAAINSYKKISGDYRRSNSEMLYYMGR